MYSNRVKVRVETTTGDFETKSFNVVTSYGSYTEIDQEIRRIVNKDLVNIVEIKWSKV